MKRSSRPRAKAELSKSLHQQLNTYALAASAAGVSLLALAPSAEGKIVYTPAHVSINKGTFYSIDLNHDSVGDVGIWFPSFNCTSEGCSSSLFVYPNYSMRNAFAMDSKGFAAALRLGARIGDFRRFETPFKAMGGPRAHFGTKFSSEWVGPWADGGKGLKNRYLALKFNIDGQFHFGWARVSFVLTSKSTFHGLLTGYAYETIPGKAINAGQTKEVAGDPANSEFGPDVSLTNPIPEAPQPAALGALAMGSPGLSIWRRKETSLDGQ
jgi:hypothetical protein